MAESSTSDGRCSVCVCVGIEAGAHAGGAPVTVPSVLFQRLDQVQRLVHIPRLASRVDKVGVRVGACLLTTIPELAKHLRRTREEDGARKKGRVSEEDIARRNMFGTKQHFIIWGGDPAAWVSFSSQLISLFHALALSSFPTNAQTLTNSPTRNTPRGPRSASPPARGRRSQATSRESSRSPAPATWASLAKSCARRPRRGPRRPA